MNILIPTADYYAQIGGKFTHILMLKKGLEELGNSVEVVYPKRSIITKLIIGGPGKILDALGLGVYYRQYLIKELLKREIMRRLRIMAIDVINVEDIVAFWAINEIKGHGKVILTIHGELAQEMESAGHIKYSFEKNLFLQLEKNAYKNADYIIAVDTRLRNHVANLAPGSERKLCIINNFIDVEAFNQKVSNLNKKKAFEGLGISDRNKIVLVPRRLVLKCGVIYAIKAAELIVNKLGRKDVVFVIVGDGPEKGNLLSYINDNKLNEYVKMFNGVIYDEMAKFYRAADIVLVPSIDVKGYKEATSLSVLEAMAAGIPVIASDLGGLAEIVKNGKTGILVHEKSYESIAENVMKIIDNDSLGTSLAEEAHGYVLSNHSYKNAAQRFVEIYKK